MEIVGFLYFIVASIIRWQVWLVLSLVALAYVIFYDNSLWMLVGVFLILTLLTSFVPKSWKKALKLPDTI